MTKQCGVDGCTRRYRCSGYCGLHYGRMRGTGTTDAPPTRATVCSIDACDRRVAAWGWCALHYYRWKRKGDVNWQPVQRTDINYAAAHLRIIAARGSASRQKCVDCGGDAREWSYTHEDPNELCDDIGRPFSLDINQYVPRCRKCHRRLDATQSPQCSVNGCETKMKAKGLCSKHYQRKRWQDGFGPRASHVCRCRCGRSMEAAS